MSSHCEPLQRVSRDKPACAHPRPDHEEVLRRRAQRKRLKRERKSGVGEAGRPNVHKRGRDRARLCMQMYYDGRKYYGWQKQCVQKDGKKRSRNSMATGIHYVEKISDTISKKKLGKVNLFPTIQGTLEDCLRPVLGQNARFIASGRTDSRVSARAQMVQFDANMDRLREHVRRFQCLTDGSITESHSVEVPQSISPAKTASKVDNDTTLVRAMALLLHHFNAVLPDTIRVLSLFRVAKDFNVMQPAWKRYIYTFQPTIEGGVSLKSWCEHVLCPSEYRDQLSLVKTGDTGNCEQATLLEPSFKLTLPLDESTMNSAASLYVGTHDFAGFQSRGGRKSTTRTVYSCTVAKTTNDGEASKHGTRLQLIITGSGFLTHMVRIIAGTLLEVGCGIRTIAGAKRPLETLSRKDAGPTLPGAQLCLDYVHYDQLNDDVLVALP